MQKSFNDMRTVNGTVCATYGETRVRLGLLCENIEYNSAHHDSFASSIVLQTHVYATIVAYCYPTDPVEIFTAYHGMFTEDIRKRIGSHPILQTDE